MSEPTVRSPDRALARIDAGAIEQNCKQIAAQLQSGTQLCAVVKADGYGHGAIWAAEAAVAGGATWLATATVEEALELRSHFPKPEILVMGALTHEGLRLSIRNGFDFVAWDGEFIRAAEVLSEQIDQVAKIHIKHDSGMGRLGERNSAQALALADSVAGAESIRVRGLMTHFATADEEDASYFEDQLVTFGALARKFKDLHSNVVVHAANSAAALREPESHFDMVRCGIAIYGLDPFHKDPAARSLVPALSLHSYVAQVKLIESGGAVGYGRKWVADRPTYIAVAPIGYGDGVRRGLTNTGEALIGGRRYRFAGTVSMDNVAVELGEQTDIGVGDTVTLIGEQEGEQILAEDVAARLDTINYEITCGISSRVRRLPQL